MSVSGSAATQFIEVAGADIAYRMFGAEDGVPLVLTHRFRGTMDHWDPALLDALACERRIIVFDNAGIGASTGKPADSVPGMAFGAAVFLNALGFRRVDVLGWSLGGAVAQWLAVLHPELVRRLVLGATGPGGVPDTPPTAAQVWPTATKPVNDDEDFLYLFFPGNAVGRAAGLASLRRLDARLTASRSTVGPDAVTAQLTALRSFSAGADALYPRLAEITAPTFVANGFHDVMVPAHEAYVMAKHLPDAQLALYPRSGHAFLFQHAELFAGHVLEFLS
ncbi:alpha/beta fold hydrolase [Nocardia sp. NPDC052566]|uniref:alpha/beta fold hydrolase n=1 Tax=Nocardia sp. NPDC052566 TaxID=3364330 RepID=UPI0037C6FC95